jgi:hypothetical protein
MRLKYVNDSVYVSDALDLLSISQTTSNLPSHFFKLVHRDSHADFAVLCSVYFEMDFRAEYFVCIVGAQNDVDFPLTAHVFERLASY